MKRTLGPQLRKGFNVDAFARVIKDGSLEPPYDSVYNKTHLVLLLLKKIKNKVYGRDVVLTILGFEIILSLICIILKVLP